MRVLLLQRDRSGLDFQCIKRSVGIDDNFAVIIFLGAFNANLFFLRNASPKKKKKNRIKDRFNGLNTSFYDKVYVSLLHILTRISYNVSIQVGGCICIRDSKLVGF